MLVLVSLGVLVSFILLAEVTDKFFVSSLEKIASRLKLSQDVAGASLLAIGSSAPELFVALISVFRPDSVPDIGAGTIVGSAIFNILMITGISLMYRTGKVHWQPLIRDLLFYGNAVLLMFLIFKDGRVDFAESVMLLAAYGLYIFVLSQWKKVKFETIPANSFSPVVDIANRIGPLTKVLITKVLSKFWQGLMLPFRQIVKLLFLHGVLRHSYWATFLLSIVYIGLASFGLVEGAVYLSERLGISQAIIGLTVVAIGTSVPDLFGSIAVAKKGKIDMAVSNAVGSNVFDILIGLGLPWALVLAFRQSEIVISTQNLDSSIILLLATIVTIFFIFGFQRWNLKRWSGAVLIFLYLIYFFYIIF